MTDETEMSRRSLAPLQEPPFNSGGCAAILVNLGEARMARRMKDDENTPRERDEFLDALGARVKAARLRKGLTQKELSMMIGASPSWIHLLEDGQQNAMIC